ncbi:hypothetical protein NE237_021630 [Protea cynaroides]|uniref:DC1 domain-containing protein n=1 Tax=Protea cynaroides TaxID=273540 RepID=A0A9Q0HBM7_9MAGN|nr:hypothetical protein NE237_021630 [Protea cynaroides]
MVRPNYNQSIQHFSHPHPLELSNIQQHQPTSNLPPCAACKHPPSGPIYTCRTCNFILHLSCSERPQFITHTCDPNHTLTLLPFPAYPDGAFTCDACGLQDNCFSYHCRICSLDLHIHCASMPNSLNHQAHQHTLRLSNRPPPPELTYNCDICNGVVVNQWTYDCLPCDFGFHLTCASNPHPRVINNLPNTAVNSAATQAAINSIRLAGSRNAMILTSPNTYYLYETSTSIPQTAQGRINALRLRGSRNCMNLTRN